ncbi:fatty acid synthase alpha subunit Lsd1 [Coemansia sp. RSA 2399]|nr:fatty acid synthase alpha subunit Lsd1 [Coemansia sp. RSA 2399]
MTSTDTVYIPHGDIKVLLQLALEPAIQARDAAKHFVADATISTEIELFAAFLEFCVKRHSAIAPAILDAFAECFDICPNAKDIHEAVNEHTLDKAGIQRVLRAFYSLWDDTSAQHHYRRKTASDISSALFSSDDLHLMAMFGGQPGGLGNPIDEAVWLFDVYRPILSDYIANISEFMHTESQDPRLAHAYPLGLDFFKWLTSPDSTPKASYLQSVSVKLPVVGLTQFLQIMVLYKTLGLAPGELVDRFKAKGP